MHCEIDSLRAFKLMDALGKLTESTLPSSLLLDALLKLSKNLKLETSQAESQLSNGASSLRCNSEKFCIVTPPVIEAAPKMSHYSCKRPPGITQSILRPSSPVAP